MIYLLFLYLLVFAFVSYRRLDWAIYLIIIGLLSYLIRFSLFVVPMTALEAMILIAFFVFVIKNYSGIIANLKLKIKNLKLKNDYPYKWQLILLLIISTLAVFISSDKTSALGIWKAYFIEPIMFYILFMNAIRTKEQVKKVFWSLGACASLVSAFGVYQWFTGYGIPNPYWINVDHRITSFFEYPNAVGLLLAPIAVLFFGLCAGEDSRAKKVIYGFLAILFLVAIAMAKSQGALVGVFAGAVLVGLWLKNSRRMTIYFLILCALAFSLLSNVREEVVNQIDFNTPSGAERLALWKATGSFLKDHYAFGAGLSAFQEEIKPFKLPQQQFDYMYPHNFILNFWVELGLAGLLVFIWLIIEYFIKIIKNIKSFDDKEYRLWNIILFGVMITILVHGLVDAPYFKNDLAVLWWTIFGVVGVLSLQKELKIEN